MLFHTLLEIIYYITVVPFERYRYISVHEVFWGGIFNAMIFS